MSKNALSTLNAAQLSAPKNRKNGWFKADVTENWNGGFRIAKGNPLKAVWNDSTTGGHFLFSVAFAARANQSEGLTAEVIQWAGKVFGAVGAADVQIRADGAYMLVAKDDFERVVEALHSNGLLTRDVSRYDGFACYGSRKWTTVR